MRNLKMATPKTKTSSDSILANYKLNGAISRRYAKEVYALISKYYTHISDDVIQRYINTGNFAQLTANELIEQAGLSLDQYNKNVDGVAGDFTYQIGNSINSSLLGAYSKIDKKIPIVLYNPVSLDLNTKNMINLQAGKITGLLDYEVVKMNAIIQNAIVQNKPIKVIKDEIEKTGIIQRANKIINKASAQKVKNRINLIANNQLTYAYNVMWKNKTLELEQFLHIWRHPPKSVYKVGPRPSHVAVNNKQFDIRKGMFIDGEWIQPGEIINCECYSQIIISKD